MTESEPIFVRVDSNRRIVIPTALSSVTACMTGNQPLDAWLLMNTPQRFRLISKADAENDLTVSRLIKMSSSASDAGPAEFEDAAVVALRARVRPVRLSRHDTGWRLTLPTIVAQLMQLDRGDSKLAILAVPPHIEIWSSDALASALKVPFGDLL